MIRAGWTIALCAWTVPAALLPALLAPPPFQTPAPPPALPATAITAIRALVESAVSRDHLAGIVVAVSSDDAGLFEMAAGNARLSPRTPMRTDSRLQIGSITKSFTAVAVLHLAERGLVDLDRPLASYLDGLPAQWSAITIRNVLAHTAGLWDWEAANALDFTHEYTDADFVRLVASHPLAFPPGSRFAYTNSSYPLLASLVARVAGTPFERYVEAHVFTPAGLKATEFWTTAQAPLPLGYFWKDGAFLAGPEARPRILAPNGGVLSTAADLTAFAAALRAGRVLRPATVASMWRPVTLPDGSTSPYGLGWFSLPWEGRRLVHHIGETGAGFASSLQLVPEVGITVAVLANTAPVLPVYTLSQDIVRVALRAR